VVAVDDGSTDESPCLLKKAAERDPRIRPILRSHQGLVPALQAGVAVAKGEFIARMDADDVGLPDRLSKQVRFLRDNPDVVAVGGGVRYLIHGEPSPKTTRPPLCRDEVSRVLKRDSPLVHPTAMIRREALEKIGGYRAPFPCAQDYDLWLRLSEIGALANIPDIVLHYRITSGQITVRHLRAALLEKLGAQTCAAYRRINKPDPAPTDGVIDRAWLLDHGWTAVEVDGHLIDTFVDRIWWLVDIGMLEAAEALADQLGQLQVVSSLRTVHRFRWRWESARVAWQSAHRGLAAGRLAASFLASPELWFKKLRDRLGRGAGRG